MASKQITHETEHDIQSTLIVWWHYQSKKWKIPEQLLYAIPNGGHRNIVTATKLKHEGVRAGVPDLFLAFPKSPYHGLYIELKKPKGRASRAQLEYIQMLRFYGYYTAICYGFDDAINIIKSYLKGVLPYGEG